MEWWTHALCGSGEVKEASMEQDERYKRAKKRVIEIRRFYTHLTVYVLVMIGLFIVDYQDRGSWWFYWPLIGWGIALIYHGFKALGTGWEERKIKRFVDEETAEDARAEDESE
jgi:fatty acid desaturase